MLISLVTLITTLILLKGAESSLLEPVKQCVPTATVRGPCHVCLCSREGVFHCRPQKCEEENEAKSRPKLDCIPNNLFRQENTFCRYSDKGFWMSDNCEVLYRYIYPRTTLLHKTLRTKIQCTANSLYLIDCNICRCSEKGIIDVSLCTSRSCSPGHKAQACSYGDILRLDNQLCSCSDINYYIDRLCAQILDVVMQPLKAEYLSLIDGTDRSRRRLRSLASDCSPTVSYIVDCNQCTCDTVPSSSGRLVCTENVCRKQESKSALRQKRVNEVDSLPELNSVTDTCEPGQEYRYECNVCICAKDGSLSCTTMVCLRNLALDLKALRANVTRNGVKSLPELRYGEKCTYGKRYRVDCNICHCGRQNNLLCTKVACLHPMQPPPEAIAYKGPPPSKGSGGKNTRSKFGEEKTVGKKKKVNKNGRQKREKKEPPKPVKPRFPNLPPGLCKPGRIYQEGCTRCYCKANKKPVCSTEDACKDEPIVRQDLRALDVRTPIKDKEFNSLQVLAHAASACEPGNSYRVDCNACVCDEFKNLLCDKLLCISYSDMHRAEALKKSGLKCNSKNFVENDIIQSKCVKCSCNGTTHCKAVEGCEAEDELAMRSRSKRNGAGLAYDYNVEKCLPNHIYKDNCNKCYCQEDQTLRCTMKTCLNYNQVLMLDKQQKYLIEHGL